MLYRKKDDDSLVILKEINLHDMNAAERQMALNEVNLFIRMVFFMSPAQAFKVGEVGCTGFTFVLICLFDIVKCIFLIENICISIQISQ